MKKLFYSLFAILAIVACSGNDVENGGTGGGQTPPKQPQITLNATAADFTTEGGSNTITFTSTDAWTAEIVNNRADDWCWIEPTSGPAGNATITVTTTANDTPDERTASVIIKAGMASKTVKVSQKQKDALTVTSSKFEVAAEGGEVVVEVKANIDFEYTIDEAAKEWIQYEGTRAMKTSTLKFAIAQNEDTEKREGKITIKSGELNEVVTIYQAGDEPSIVISKNEYIVASAGETIAVEVTSNVDVEVEIPSDAGWISENTTRGVSTNTYYFDIDENVDYDQRSTEIKFTNKANNLSEVVKITQAQKDAIVVAKDSYTIDSEGDEIVIEVGHNIDFDVEISADWITRKETRAFNTDKLTFVIAENKDYDNREGTIVFKSKNDALSQIVKVYQAQKDALIISKKDIVVSAESGTISFELQTNVEFKVSEPNVDWLRAVTTRSLTTHTLHYEYDANTSYDSREAQIIVTDTKNNKSETITITQAQKDAIVLAKSEYEFAGDGGNLDFEIQTNVDITVTISDNAKDWIQQVDTRALETKTLYFNISTCSTKEDREGTITISGGNATQTITVKQSGVQEILEKEREVLIAFYKATGGDNWTRNDNWCSDKPVGEWYGVETYENGVIWGLHLGYNNLLGTITEEIGNLTNLESIDLGSNNLSGEIPSAIGNLNKLENLGLSQCNLTGPIPKEIGNLSKLRWLNLQFNSLSGSIPEELGNLKNLESLTLSWNCLTGKVPTSIMQLPIWEKQWQFILHQSEGYGFSPEGVILYAPQFTTQTLSGAIISNDIFKENEYTVIYHFVDYCPWSELFTPKLIGLYNTYKDCGLGVFSATYQDSATTRAYVEKHGIPWEVIAEDCEDSWYNVSTFINYYTQSPDVAVFDQNGKIVFCTAFNNYEDLPEFLAEVLEAPYGMDPSYSSTDYSKDGEVKQLQTATKGDGIDIVLMGDAYSDRLIADGSYEDDMRTAMEQFFAVEPYKSFRDHFNVYSVTAVSANETYAESSSTVFEGYFGEGTHVGGNDEKVFTYAQKAISADRIDDALIVVMMNSTSYAGTCYMYYPTKGDWGDGTSISYFPVGADAEALGRVLHHEAGGHGFSKLGDEYAYEYMGVIPGSEIDAAQMLGEYGWYKNVDFTSDPTQVKWYYFLTDSRYANEGLGVYEGAYTYWSGAYRPTYNSIMNANIGGFNAPSREAIYYRIHKLAYGEAWQYDYEEFVEWDARNRATASSTRGIPYRLNIPDDFKPLHPPVVIKKSWRNAKNNTPVKPASLTTGREAGSGLRKTVQHRTTNGDKSVKYWEYHMHNWRD